MTILWENGKRNSGRERRVCEKFRLGNWPEADYCVVHAVSRFL